MRPGIGLEQGEQVSNRYSFAIGANVIYNDPEGEIIGKNQGCKLDQILFEFKFEFNLF